MKKTNTKRKKETKKSVKKRVANLAVISSILALTLIVLISIAGKTVKLGSENNYVSAAILSKGPVVGGVTENSAKIFARTDAAASVSVEYSANPDLSESVKTSPLATIQASDFTVISELKNLQPETNYYYRIIVDGVPQQVYPYPSFRTFPTPGTEKDFKFIVLNDFIAVPKATRTWPTFTNAAQENADFAFIGGDFDHRNPVTLNAKRKVKKDLYDPSSLGLSDFVNGILRKMPIVHVWDDHDSGADNNDKNYPYWNLSCQAYREYVPGYNLPTSVPCGIWQKFQYAQADFFILDERSQRDPGTEIDGPNKSMLDGNNVGANGQLEWLKQGLLNSTARWKIIFSTVVTNPAVKPTDAWAAYKTEWASLKNFITSNKVNGVLFITGDLHIGGIDKGTNSGFPEMVVPGPNLEPVAGKKCASGTPGTWSEGRYYNPSGPCNGYGVVSVLTDPDRLLLQIKDQDGNVKVSYTLN